MSRHTRNYALAVSTLAAAILLALPWEPVAALGLRGLIGLASFAGLAVLAEAMAVQFGVGGPRKVHSSIAFLPYIACAATFPVAAATSAVLVALLAAEILRKRLPWVALFNISQGVCAVAVGGLLFRALDGTPDFTSFHNVVAFAALVLAFFGTNLVFVSQYVSIQQERSFTSVLRQAIGAEGGNLFYDMLASPVALIAAILYMELAEIGLLLVIFPLLLIRYSYLSKLQLQQANRDLLKVLIKAIETRDPYTSGHSVRVSALARIIAEELKLSAREVERVETAALLHDIGKIDMSYAPIIQKPTDLTDHERHTIRTHATRGADLLRNLTSLEESVILGVRHHHERFDGTGYPDGLAQEQIPLIGRIIMICDAVDAMLSDRPYRRALSAEQVRSELLRCSGAQFDPRIVNVMLRSDVLQRASDALGDRKAVEHLVAVAGA
jgi:putative nucleotidyltransferase with HDIG domain